MAVSRWISAVVFAAIVIDMANCHKCFVCTPNNGHRRRAELHNLKKAFPGKQLHRCADYHHSRKDDFILECPSGEKGCLTKFDGGSVTRTCGQVAVDDCDVANEVTFCYCKSEACNSPSKKLSEPEPMALAGTSDDEDLVPRKFRGQEYLGLDESGSGDYPDDYDMTEPPPFVEEEDTKSSKTGSTINDIQFEEKPRKTSSASMAGSGRAMTFFLVLISFRL